MIFFLVAFGSAFCQSGITIESPRDYQVFQRQTKESGAVAFSGNAPDGADSVQGRFNSRWTDLILEPATHHFSGRLTAPAGGFFAAEVRVLQAGKVLVQTSIPHVGIGEVFVVAGQSNATNYGETRQQTSSGMVVSFDGVAWAIANDPQPGVQDNSSKGSFVPAFGDALYARLHVPVAVASVGHGSTSVRQWLPKGEAVQVLPTMPRYVVQDASGKLVSDGQLFNGMMKRIRELGLHGFRAMLWHQGESDAHQTPAHQISADTYRQMMTRVIQATRDAAGWDVPWFVAQVSYHSPSDTSAPEVREAQSALWRAGIALEGPDTDTLTGDMRQNNGQGVHLSAAGLQAHGRLWAGKVAAWLESQP